MNYFGDYHTHTKYSHGTGTVDDNVRVAVERGLQCVAITDHGFRHTVYNVHRAAYPRMLRDVEAARARYGIGVLMGLETNLTGYDGRIDVRADDIAKLDVLLCGYHSLVYAANLKALVSFSIPTLLASALHTQNDRRYGYNTEAYLRAVDKFPIDILTHPGHKLPCDLVAVARLMKEKGTYFELNCKHVHEDIDTLAAVAETGVEFIINSDAHTPPGVGVFTEGEALCARAGIPLARVANYNREPQFRSKQA